MYQNDNPVIKNGVISLFLLLFFPISFLMVLIRIVSHRNLSYHKHLDAKYFGKVLLVLFLIMGFAYTVQLAGDNKPLFSVFFVCILILLVPGIALRVRAATLLKRLNEMYARYRNLIFVEGVTAIDSLAQITSQRPSVVTNDLLRMIQLGVLKDCFVDPHSRSLVFENTVWSAPQMTGSTAEFSTRVEYNFGFATDGPVNVTIGDPVSGSYAEKSAPPAPKTVECHGCGAKTVLQPGEAASCGYCGSDLA
ncbi:hypothetical protein [Paenibacillus puerhi]|uniref:hypothetical protein n=1 Tax=Paenibacillus puerhi TaxID=2692622 RepID=UPI0013585F6C|nr:hypothetical protein [Paenibacillus puerhi]